MESKELALKIAKILDSKKAKDIRVLKICDVSSIGDYFVICSAGNKSHVQSLSDEVDFTLDRPFLFAVTGADGMTLFMGVVNQP